MTSAAVLLVFKGPSGWKFVRETLGTKRDKNPGRLRAKHSGGAKSPVSSHRGSSNGGPPKKIDIKEMVFLVENDV